MDIAARQAILDHYKIYVDNQTIRMISLEWKQELEAC